MSPIRTAVRPPSHRNARRLFVTLIAILLPAAVGAESATGPIRNFDATYSRPAVSGSTERSTSVMTGRRGHVDERFAVPSFLWVGDLSVAAKAGTGSDRLVTARAVASQIAPLYGLSPADLASANARIAHDTGRGPWIATFEREVDGVEVWRDTMSILFDVRGRAVAVSGFIAPEALGVGATGRFRLKPESVAAIAAGDATNLPFSESAFRVSGREHGRYGYLECVAESSALSGEIRFKRVFYHMPDRLIASYYLELEVPTKTRSTHLWGYVVSAEDGALLNRTSLTSSASYSYRVWADSTSPHVPLQGPTADFMPHLTGVPDGSFPSYVSPTLITLQNVPFSKNDPWLPASATVTTGNNVEAYADISGADGFDASDVRATTTSTSTFDRTYDTGAAPDVSADQRMASVTQLFFANNFLHDWFYDAGFDEASGNAQTDNYGRGGLGSDSIMAEAQDTDGTELDNANMSTPADGSRPRMQMYLWSPATSATVTTTATGGSSLDYGTAEFGAQTFDLTAALSLTNDGSGASVTDGCETILTDLTGKIALIDRGNCNFVVKVKSAQTAGAVGVLIADNGTGLGNMGGTDPTITIPSLMITQTDGDTIKIALGGGTVTATMTRTVGTFMLDGTIDNGIVAHEWGHYLTNRLVSLGTNQADSMGEGWGDFVALLMGVRDGDDPDGVYSASQYAMQSIKNAAYFGIRRYPYSTNMSVNPLTFKHIEDGVALPTGPPINSNGVNNAEVHNAGEVWAQMLWECYAALLNDSGRLTFTEAQNRMKEYLVVSLKMTPADPTFTEARDAVLAAADANDTADYVLFCQAFARRGIGLGAVSPARNSTTHTGVVESFGCAGDLKQTAATLDDSISGCDVDGILDQGEAGKLTLWFKNNGGEGLNNSTLTVTSPNGAVSFPNGATVSIPSTTAGQTVSTSVDVRLSTGASGVQDLTFNLSYDDPDFEVAGPRTGSVKFEGNVDEQESASASDDVEASTTAWSQGGDPADGGEWARVADSVTSHRLHAADVAAVSDSSLVSPSLQVTGPLVITFNHRHVFERSQGKNWDGGVIEISTDDGASWTDIGGSASPGYNGTINSTASNPLGGRQGFTGTSSGHPSYLSTTVNLGTSYNSQTVRIRFRLGTDEAVGATGWDVDNIAVSGISNTPFNVRNAQPVCAKLSISDASVTEGNSGTTPVDVTVSMVGAPGATVTVNWETMADGDATSDVDFVADSGMLTFLEGETSKTFAAQVIGDTDSELDETFSLHLSSPVNATIDDHHGMVTITTDDAPVAPTGVIATATTPTSVNVNWSSVPQAVLYQVYRKSAGTAYVLKGSSTSLEYVDSTVSAGTSYLYTVLAVDSEDRPSAQSSPDLATTVIFTDPTIVAGVTNAKTSHMTELRTAVNAVRALAGLGSASFTDPSLETILVKRVHVTELRSALDEARSVLGLTAVSWTDPTITPGVTRIKAAHVTELRGGVQ